MPKFDSLENHAQQIIRTGNKLYEIDGYGRKVPIATNQSYIRRRSKMHQQMKEAAKAGLL
jgi:hypothetical protein